jgi:hypothetical protein
MKSKRINLSHVSFFGETADVLEILNLKDETIRISSFNNAEYAVVLRNENAFAEPSYKTSSLYSIRNRTTNQLFYIVLCNQRLIEYFDEIPKVIFFNVVKKRKKKPNGT